MMEWYDKTITSRHASTHDAALRPYILTSRDYLRKERLVVLQLS
jgi:hypothetical protein